MKVTNEIKEYISKEVKKRISNHEVRPFNDKTMASVSINDIPEEFKKFIINDIKNRFQISDEIISQSNLSIFNSYHIRYNNVFDNFNIFEFVEKIIIEIQLNSRKFKNTSDIDNLIDNRLEEYKTKKEAK